MGGRGGQGVGCGQALEQHCCSYFLSTLMVLITLVCLVAYGMGVPGPFWFLSQYGASPDPCEDLPSWDQADCSHEVHNQYDVGWLIAAAFAYVVYLVHIACCVSLTKSFSNETCGLEKVVELMHRPRGDNPRYSWTVQCYHYTTVTYTETGQDGYPV